MNNNCSYKYKEYKKKNNDKTKVDVIKTWYSNSDKSSFIICIIIIKNNKVYNVTKLLIVYEWSEHKTIRILIIHKKHNIKH